MSAKDKSTGAVQTVMRMHSDGQVGPHGSDPSLPSALAPTFDGNETAMACQGADTVERHERVEHMEECRHCGTQVRHDLTEHKFFGFAAGCVLLQRKGAS